MKLTGTLKHVLPIVLLVLASNHILFSQSTFLGHPIYFTPKQSPNVQFNEVELKSTLTKKYSPIVKNEKDLDEFVTLLVQGKKHYMYSNSIYDKMDTAVVYLQQICAKFYPDHETRLQLKIVRDPSLNACAFEDGTIFVNIGLLARYNTEAEIAATLGHEIGHVVKSHAYKSYKAKKKYFKSTYLGTISTNKSFISSIIKTNAISNRLIGQEKESDDFSMELIKNSPYSTASFYTEQQLFFDLEKKEKALRSYKSYNSDLRLRTHPNSESRLDKAKRLPFNGGKNFLVDSLYFVKLKKQAIDECIHLYFEEQDFDQCIELAFIEHLKQPDDPFYLFYLTECTRRLIEYNKDYKKLSFISGQYLNWFCPEKKPNETVVVFTNNHYEKIKREKINSVLYKLTSNMLLTDSADLKEFKNKTLLRKDTLAFYTYSDALDYFIALNTEKGFKLNNLFTKNTSPDSCKSEHEKMYCNIKTDLSNYNSKANKGGKVLFAIYDIEHIVSENNGIANTDFNLIHNSSDIIYSKKNGCDIEGRLALSSDMNFNDRCLILNYLDLIYPLIKEQKLKQASTKDVFKIMNGAFDPESLIARDTVAFDFDHVTPELVQMMNTYNFNGIVFSAIYISNETSTSIYGKQNTESWIIKHFYLDVKHKQIKFYLAAGCANIVAESVFGKVDTNYNTFQCFYDTVLKNSE